MTSPPVLFSLVDKRLLVISHIFIHYMNMNIHIFDDEGLQLKGSKNFFICIFLVCCLADVRHRAFTEFNCVSQKAPLLLNVVSMTTHTNVQSH